MCLAIPVLILEKRKTGAIVEIGGITRLVSLALTPQAKPGDYILVHAGYAIGILDEEEAAETLRLLNEMEELSGDEGGNSLRLTDGTG